MLFRSETIIPPQISSADHPLATAKLERSQLALDASPCGFPAGRHRRSCERSHWSQRGDLQRHASTQLELQEASRRDNNRRTSILGGSQPVLQLTASLAAPQHPSPLRPRSSSRCSSAHRERHLLRLRDPGRLLLALSVRRLYCRWSLWRWCSRRREEGFGEGGRRPVCSQGGAEGGGRTGGEGQAQVWGSWEAAAR